MLGLSLSCSASLLLPEIWDCIVLYSHHETICNLRLCSRAMSNYRSEQLCTRTYAQVERMTNDELRVCTWLTHLYANFRSQVTNDIVLALTQLRVLYLNHATHVDSDAIRQLTLLRELKITGGPITTEALATLPSLINLAIGNCDHINDGISVLTGLVMLNLLYNRTITDHGISKLTSLTNLALHNGGYYGKFTDRGIAPLTNLTSLSLGAGNDISDDGLSLLTSLTCLNLGNSRITDRGIIPLTRLCMLKLHENTLVGEGVRALPITTLDVGGHNNRVPFMLMTSLKALRLPNSRCTNFSYLTALTELHLIDNMELRNHNLEQCTNLTKLTITGTHKLNIAKLPVTIRVSELSKRPQFPSTSNNG